MRFQGYQLIGPYNNGIFNPTAQQCLACNKQQYILDCLYCTCEECPIGASCDGASLTGLVKGSVWVPDLMDGIYILKSCPPGYELQNTSAGSPVFSSALQQCSLCPQSFFCVGGDAPAALCPGGTYSYTGSDSSLSCTVIIYVVLVTVFPSSKSDFNTQMQSQYVSAVAAAAATTPDHVAIASIVDSNRRASSSVLITAKISTNSSTSANSVAKFLTSDALNSKLSEFGLPSVTIESVQVEQSSPNQQAVQPMDIVPALVGSIGAFAAIIIAGFLLWRARFAPASRRLMRAERGVQADQKDLPYELRKKYMAVQVMGSGSYGVVLEAWQISSGRATVRRAIKLVHSQNKRFTDQEIVRLDREVFECTCSF